MPERNKRDDEIVDALADPSGAMGGRFDRVDGKLREHDLRFDHIDQRVMEVDGRLDRIENFRAVVVDARF